MRVGYVLDICGPGAGRPGSGDCARPSACQSGGERRREVRHRPSLTLDSSTLDLMDEDVSRPSVFDGLADIPLTLRRLFHLIEQRYCMIPRDLCKHLLHKYRVRPCLRKRPHILQVPGEKPLISGNSFLRSAGSCSITFAPHTSCLCIHP